MPRTVWVSNEKTSRELIGYFTTEIGTLNQIVHMWGYESMAQRQERRTALYSDPDGKSTCRPSSVACPSR